MLSKLSICDPLLQMPYLDAKFFRDKCQNYSDGYKLAPPLQNLQYQRKDTKAQQSFIVVGETLGPHTFSQMAFFIIA